MTSRILPIEEWDRLPEYMDDVTMRLRPCQTRVCVVEDDAGNIIGRSMLYPTLYAEDTWIDPAYRKHPAVARHLWGLMHTAAADLGFEFMVSTVLSEDAKALLLRPEVRGEVMPGQQIAFPVQGARYGR